jgi:hypothetical protein
VLVRHGLSEEVRLLTDVTTTTNGKDIRVDSVVGFVFGTSDSLQRRFHYPAKATYRVPAFARTNGKLPDRIPQAAPSSHSPSNGNIMNLRILLFSIVGTVLATANLPALRARESDGEKAPVDGRRLIQVGKNDCAPGKNASCEPRGKQEVPCDKAVDEDGKLFLVGGV